MFLQPVHGQTVINGSVHDDPMIGQQAPQQVPQPTTQTAASQHHSYIKVEPTADEHFSTQSDLSSGLGEQQHAEEEMEVCTFYKNNFTNFLCCFNKV